MKRIYGTTAVEGRAKREKGVKVQLTEFSANLYFLQKIKKEKIKIKSLNLFKLTQWRKGHVICMAWRCELMVWQGIGVGWGGVSGGGGRRRSFKFLFLWFYSNWIRLLWWWLIEWGKNYVQNCTLCISGFNLSLDLMRWAAIFNLNCALDWDGNFHYCPWVCSIIQDLRSGLVN